MRVTNFVLNLYRVLLGQERYFYVMSLSDPKPVWRHGSCQFGKWRFEWCSFMRNCRLLAIGFQCGCYDYNTATLVIAIPFFSLYISKNCERHFDDRELSISLHDGGLWIKLWVDDDWHRDRPWHRNTIHIDFWELLARPKTKLVVDESERVLIPLPEGCYRGSVRPERRVTTYRFGFKRESTSHHLEVEDGGIPYSLGGKYPREDDALISLRGDSPTGVVSDAVAKVLHRRMRYGQTAEELHRSVTRFARPEARWPDEVDANADEGVGNQSGEGLPSQ